MSSFMLLSSSIGKPAVLQTSKHLFLFQLPLSATVTLPSNSLLALTPMLPERRAHLSSIAALRDLITKKAASTPRQ